MADSSDEDEFKNSTDTINYLDKEKEDKQGQFQDLAMNRHSMVGSYLFEKDIKTLDFKQTAKILKDTVQSPKVIENLKESEEAKDNLPRDIQNSGHIGNNDLLHRDLAKKELEIARLTQKDQEIIDLLSTHQNGFEILLSRIKQSTVNSQRASLFLKKRAQIETDYATQMIKLASLDSDFCSGFSKMHMEIGDLRSKFAGSILEMSENIQVLARNTERSRKQLKESVLKLLNESKDSEMLLEKAKIKFESVVEEYDRNHSGQQKSKFPKLKLGSLNSSLQSVKSRIQQELKVCLINKAPPKNEEEAKQRVFQAAEKYKSQLNAHNKQKLHNQTVIFPKYVVLLKDAIEDCDVCLKKYLVKYAKTVESLVMVEATMISPLEAEKELGLLHLAESIDYQGQFEQYVFSQDLGKKLQYDETDGDLTSERYIQMQASSASINIPGSSAFTSNSNGSTIFNASNQPYGKKDSVVAHYNLFGSDLSTLMSQSPSNDPVPLIVKSLVKAIEPHMKEEGLYRLSGSLAQIQQLKSQLDNSPSLVPKQEDVHVLCGCLKLFFRELCHPLFPLESHPEFMKAAAQGDARLRLIQIHEQVNLLDDANYATLKFLLGHLLGVVKVPANMMNEYNLGIVWGPTLFMGDGCDVKMHALIVETLLVNYDHIFDMDS